MNEEALNILRGAVTVSLFILFIVLAIWAWSPRRKRDFTAAANLVFDPTDAAEQAKAPLETGRPGPTTEESR